jgi:hypothetical protein
MSAPVGFAVAEFGRGLLRQFVTGLGGGPRPGPPSATARRPGAVRPEPTGAAHQPAAVPTESDERVPVPGETVSYSWRADEGSALLAYAPLAGALAVGVLLGWLLGRRGRR